MSQFFCRNSFGGGAPYCATLYSTRLHTVTVRNAKVTVVLTKVLHHLSTGMCYSLGFIACAIS